ncbi:lysozyme inhibitor LprI family protein [Tabrizicola sp.]|uniref:lysozyme inhibitor LprI family protein n=1 Tax=Tabrizicola sp. TaxID=2005166 RepID=UPI003F312B9B
MFKPVLVILACMAGHAASADVANCANAVTQMELNECAYADWQAADADLNAVYKVVIARLKQWDANLPRDEKSTVETLRQAQRAWIIFRDKTCEAEGDAMDGGSAEPLLVYGCMRRVTIDRTVELQEMLAVYSG